MYLIAKSVSKWYPELFLIISVIVYWALTATLVNPVAISLLVLLVAQLRFKNKTFGIFGFPPFFDCRSEKEKLSDKGKSNYNPRTSTQRTGR